MPSSYPETANFDLSMAYERYGDPAVPPDLMQYTCGTTDFNEFLRSGMEVATMLSLAAREYFGNSLNDFTRVLDFGCGCGRILRFLRPRPEGVHACDVGEAVAGFAKEHYPWAYVYRNELMPPLEYPDGYFDLVYSFSVFSHLSLETEQAWLPELVRVGAPGCAYLLTVHGDWYIEQTLGAERGAATDAGFYFKKVHSRSSGFPEYYEASYHTSGYIREHWSNFFDVLAVIRGDDPSRYLFEGRQPQPARPIRPMGQDLVVARKRI